jgi:Immunity protein 35
MCAVITEAEARRIAESRLGEQLATGQVAIIEVVEHSIGWSYHWQSSEFIRTGDDMIALTGNWPILVSRRDGRVLGCDQRGVEYWITQHDRRQAWDDDASEHQRILTEAVEVLSYIGPAMHQPVLGRLRKRCPEASESQLEQAIREATSIGLRALELTRMQRRALDPPEVPAPDWDQVEDELAKAIGPLAREYPDVYPNVWSHLVYRAKYWWEWEI